MSKYDVIKLEVLIKTIQENTVKLSDKGYKKTITPTTFARRVRELDEMRGSVIGRLTKMDRTVPEFFPIGSLVEYKPPDDPASWKTSPVQYGRVKAYEGRWIYMELEGKEEMIQVDPRNLTLRFIRKMP